MDAAQRWLRSRRRPLAAGVPRLRTRGSPRHRAVNSPAATSRHSPPTTAAAAVARRSTQDSIENQAAVWTVRCRCCCVSLANCSRSTESSISHTCSVPGIRGIFAGTVTRPGRRRVRRVDEEGTSVAPCPCRGRTSGVAPGGRVRVGRGKGVRPVDRGRRRADVSNYEPVLVRLDPPPRAASRWSTMSSRSCTAAAVSRRDCSSPRRAS